MANIRTSVEDARGCGFRKGGGIYLIAGAIPRPCGKLSIPLTTCPTCSAGIKPARGWTWVEAAALIGDKECDAKGDYCSMCPLNKPMGWAGLLWIGEKFYPTPADWIKESLNMGVSRRISQVPRELEIGKTWVLVAHRKTIKTDGDCSCGLPDGAGPGHLEKCGYYEATYTPAIFYAFRPTAIEYVVKGDETEDELNKLEKRGFSLVKVVKAHSAEDKDKQEEDEAFDRGFKDEEDTDEG
jgi:hypothetical protein